MMLGELISLQLQLIFSVSKTLLDHNLNLWRAVRKRWRKEGCGEAEGQTAEREAALH